MHDLRLAVRALGRARGFSLAAVVTLAIGIAASTIVYAVVDAMLLRPLPFGGRGARLITIHSTHATQSLDWDDAEVSFPDLMDLRDASRTLEGLEGVVTRNVSLAADRETERVAGASVTPGLFGMLGVSPQIGRDFRDEDAAAIGRESVVLISHGVWQRLFAGDRSVLGRTVPVNGRALTVIGVMPRGFAFPEQHDLWLPYRVPRDAGRDVRNVTGVGLLREGLSVQDARVELAALAGTLATRHPDTNRGWGIHVLDLRALFVGSSTRRGLTAMLVAVALVLMVGCANVASLLIARGMSRQGELAVRAALGAGRTRLMRLLMMESVVLAVAGGALGLLIVAWGLDALLASMPEPPPYWAEIRVDARVLAFAFLVAAVATVLSGLAPALRMSRVNGSPGVLQGGRTAGVSQSQRRFQGALVIGQVACSLSLLIGATLLSKSSAALQHTGLGFDASPLASARIYLAGDAYAPVARAAALERLVERLGRLPGAVGAAATGAIPGDDGGAGVRLVPDRGTLVPGEEVGAQMVPATSGLFETLGLRPIEGRTFSAEESRQPESDVAIVNARLAERFWPGESALGRRLRLDVAGARGLRVIGVVPDVVYEELGEESDQSRLIVYVPYVRAASRTMALLVRADGSPSSVLTPLRAAVREIDANFAAYEVLTMSDRRAMTTWSERFLGRTFTAFSATAVFMACLGIYGLTAHSAAQRRREIGVRLAVGARPRDIMRLLVGRGATLAVIGLLAGLPLAIGTSKLVAGMLFDVSPWEPRIWVLLPAALTGAVLLASLLPAHRASLIDPTEALRHD